MPVRVVVLAEAAVRALNALQPRDRATHGLVLPIVVDVLERREHRPRAVHVVRSPAPEPRAAWLLLAIQVVETTSEHRAVLVARELREQRDAARTDVGRRR